MTYRAILSNHDYSPEFIHVYQARNWVMDKYYFSNQYHDTGTSPNGEGGVLIQWDKENGGRKDSLFWFIESA